MKLPLVPSPGFLAALPPEEQERLGLGPISQEKARQRWRTGQEKELQKLVWSWLNLHHYPIFGARMDKRTRNTLGQPDFITCVQGQFLAIECKADGQTLSPEQTKQCSLIMTNHGTVCVAFCLDHVRETIRELRRHQP